MEPYSINLIFEVVGRQLPDAGVDCLMMGGHAINHYGYSRATIDVDFMIAAGDLARVRSVMKSAGFSNVSESDNVAFFNHPDIPIRVDFLQVDTRTMGLLLEKAVQVEYNGVPIRLPCLKDLIAMKLFALKSGSAKREERDFPDIVHLSVQNGLDPVVDLKPLCDRFGDDGIYDRLVKRIEEESNE